MRLSTFCIQNDYHAIIYLFSLKPIYLEHATHCLSLQIYPALISILLSLTPSVTLTIHPITGPAWQRKLKFKPLRTFDLCGVTPWSKIASDIFVYQQNHFLLKVDYYSKWPEIMILKDLSSLQVINSLKSIFSKYGIPDELISDNGPQYASKECRNSAKEYMCTFVHSTSSFISQIKWTGREDGTKSSRKTKILTKH